MQMKIPSKCVAEQERARFLNLSLLPIDPFFSQVVIIAKLDILELSQNIQLRASSDQM